MRILTVGDLVGRSGRDALAEHLPFLQKELKPDVIVVNAENSAAGFGVTPQIVQSVLDLGVSVVTTGDHIWDQKTLRPEIDRFDRLVRPLNYPKGAPGRGAVLVSLPTGHKILVAQLLGRVFMPPLDNPFEAIDQLLVSYPLGRAVQAIVVEMHAEATSEKMAMAHFLDGRVSVVTGSHTHVPTADAQIFPMGTGFQSDMGMTGDYNSVIGMDKEVPLKNFTRQIKEGRMTPAKGEATLCGLFIETDDQTGKTVSLSPVRLGGRLSRELPSF